MKILLISFSEHYPNQETIYNLHAELDAVNNIELWTMGTKNRIFKSELTKRNLLVDCPERPGITKDTFNFRKLNTVIKMINNVNPDAILFYNAHVWNHMITLRLKNKYQTYHVIHDVIPHKGDKQEKILYIYNWATGKIADHIVVHSKQFIEEFSNIFKCSEEKVKYTELWRKYEDYSPLKHTGRCLFFGRINYYKGIDYLLETVKKCPDIQFDVVGKVDHDENLEKIVNQLKEFPNVNVDNNYVDGNKMRNYFKNADLVVLPYRTATQSGVVMDAYSFSRPVVAFNVGALNEQVKHGMSGYLVEESDIDKFANSLKSYMNLSYEQKNELSNNAWKYGYEKYSIQKGADRFIRLFEN
jgi:glycosyltransferase involved in cell wall biosynthesis